jgi:hypothetical protein
MTMFEKTSCPECGSQDVLPIEYGLPGPELKARAMRGEVVLGGCIVYDGAPDMICVSCGARWLDLRWKRLLEEEDGPA